MNSEVGKVVVAGGLVGAALIAGALLAQKKAHSNPYTPSSQWPVYEYRITRRWFDPEHDPRSGLPNLGWWWLVIEMERDSNGQASSQVVTWISDRDAAIRGAKSFMANKARYQERNPNILRLFDERGQCIYAVRNVMKPPSFDPRWGKRGQIPISSVFEVPCP